MSIFNTMTKISRKSILFLTATFAMLYLSIPSITSSINSERVSNDKSVTSNTSVNWCKELHWRNPPLPFAIALASYPGSGNTWLRYLLQQATGIVTGSVSLDYSLRKRGFPAENISDGSVLVVKTHKYPPKHLRKFESAVLLIRNPRDAILAEFNRIISGHTGLAPKSAFEMKVRAPKRISTQRGSWLPTKQYSNAACTVQTLASRTVEDLGRRRYSNVWFPFVSLQLRKWEFFHNLWLTKYPGPVYIVFYEALLSDTRGTLQGILSFLNITVTEEDINCALLNKDGLYKRNKKYKNFDPFTEDMYRQINKVKTRVYTKIIDSTK
ncbi:PREDICTED: WSCD family member GA21586-like [Papilio polytes]|uniref:WSCD family member GA21586-like n=1 Tax=Papilio polytes TaxID=76194 RepID=UPI00067601C9|nr:PREDICTED: WSCD family member GA21586-like [Papilio polytes]